MADSRPTRWQKAKADSRPLRLRRELVEAAVGAVVSGVVLLAAGFSHDAVVIGATIGGSAVAAAVIVPAAERYWNWLQAPMRLLTFDVIAIRERVEQLSLSPASPAVVKPEIDVRLTLMNQKRIGDEMHAESGLYQSEVVTQAWTSGVLDFLSEHMPRTDVERFMTAGTGTAKGRLPARLDLLGEMIDRLGGAVGREPTGELGKDG